VVYAGVDAPDCGYSATPETLAATIEAARAETGKMRVYVIASGAGADAALRYMGTRPGYLDGSSLWFASYDAATIAALAGLRGSIITVHLNATADDAAGCTSTAAMIRDNGTPAVCHVWPIGTGYSAAAARDQLGL
jgi:pimeloyl-ACP methyl ester carboxylesterase